MNQLNLFDYHVSDEYKINHPFHVIYILLLSNNDLYVGITTQPVVKRLNQHINPTRKKRGSITTKTFKPIKILKIIPTNFISQSQAAHLENRCVRLCNVLIHNRTTYGGYMYYKKSGDHSPL